MTGQHQIIRLDAAGLNRMLIGFDKVIDDFEQRFAGQIHTNYPPHNVLKTGENTYEIQLAVSGFEKHEIEVEVAQNTLVVTGQRQREEDMETVYLHRGLATRDFVRTFPLADHMEVQSGSIKNGILSIYIDRIIPESAKVRKVNISGE